MFSSGEFYPGNMPIRFVLEFRSFPKVFVLVKTLEATIGHDHTVTTKWKEEKNILIFF